MTVHELVERVLVRQDEIIERLQRIEQRLEPKHWLVRAVSLPGRLLDAVLGDRS